MSDVSGMAEGYQGRPPAASLIQPAVVARVGVDFALAQEGDGAFYEQGRGGLPLEGFLEQHHRAQGLAVVAQTREDGRPARHQALGFGGPVQAHLNLGGVERGEGRRKAKTGLLEALLHFQESDLGAGQLFETVANAPFQPLNLETRNPAGGVDALPVAEQQPFGLSEAAAVHEEPEMVLEGGERELRIGGLVDRRETLRVHPQSLLRLATVMKIEGLLDEHAADRVGVADLPIELADDVEGEEGELKAALSAQQRSVKVVEAHLQRLGARSALEHVKSVLERPLGFPEIVGRAQGIASSPQARAWKSATWRAP